MSSASAGSTPSTPANALGGRPARGARRFRRPHRPRPPPDRARQAPRRRAARDHALRPGVPGHADPIPEPDDPRDHRVLARGASRSQPATPAGTEDGRRGGRGPPRGGVDLGTGDGRGVEPPARRHPVFKPRVAPTALRRRRDDHALGCRAGGSGRIGLSGFGPKRVYRSVDVGTTEGRTPSPATSSITASATCSPLRRHIGIPMPGLV